MRRPAFLILLLFCSLAGLAQQKNYCHWTGCPLAANDEAHFDPYYNGHLCENFNPAQPDFSQEYLQLQKKRYAALASDQTKQLRNYQFETSSLFTSGNDHQNGIIGLEYRRILIHISKAAPVPGREGQFLLSGKSNVNGNICDFQGTLTILQLLRMGKGTDFPGQGILFASYEFKEDPSQKHVGVFKGTFECAIAIDDATKTIRLDESFAVADGYYNRSYVGTWTSYGGQTSKKCIWGDYRLPFTFDFDCGDGEMMACDKYLPKGWAGFNQGTEYTQVNGQRRLKHEWWKPQP